MNKLNCHPEDLQKDDLKVAEGLHDTIEVYNESVGVVVCTIENHSPEALHSSIRDLIRLASEKGYVQCKQELRSFILGDSK